MMSEEIADSLLENAPQEMEIDNILFLIVIGIFATITSRVLTTSRDFIIDDTPITTLEDLIG